MRVDMYHSPFLSIAFIYPFTNRQVASSLNDGLVKVDDEDQFAGGQQGCPVG